MSAWNQAIGFRMGTYKIIEILNNIIENGSIVLDSSFDGITVPTTTISEIHINNNRFIPHDYAIKLYAVNVNIFRVDNNINYSEYISGATISERRGIQKGITINNGLTSFTGDGSTTQFKIAHGLAGTPKFVIVTPKGSTTKPDSIDWDDTYIYINYSTAPASGTSLVFSWFAEV